MSGASSKKRIADERHRHRSRARSTAKDAYRLAAEIVGSGGKLEMAALADRLAVTRVTLFRWVGNRDELLAEVLWRQWDRTWRQALGEVGGTGALYVANVCRHVMREILRAPGIQTLLAEDPEYALRILTSKRGSVQRRVVDNVRGLLAEEIREGRINSSIEPDALAYALVRIVESFIYRDQIAGEDPNVDVPAEIVALILRP